MNLSDERGQILPITAVLAMGVIAVLFLLVISVGSLYVDTTLTRQALIAAARDGTTALDFRDESLTLAPIPNWEAELTVKPTNRHCLDIAKAKARTRAALERNLRPSEGQFRTKTGDPLSAQTIVQDQSGDYLILAVGNPASLGCQALGDTHPEGEVFKRPWVYLKVDIFVQARGGGPIVAWQEKTNATSAIDVQGGSY